MTKCLQQAMISSYLEHLLSQWSPLQSILDLLLFHHLLYWFEIFNRFGLRINCCRSANMMKNRDEKGEIADDPDKNEGDKNVVSEKDQRSSRRKKGCLSTSIVLPCPRCPISCGSTIQWQWRYSEVPRKIKDQLGKDTIISRTNMAIQVTGAYGFSE